MKTTYYLIPQTIMREAANKHGFPRLPIDLITKVDGTAKQARAAAKEREKELNDGAEYTTEAVVAAQGNPEAKPLWFVTPEPWGSARGFLSFREWPCNRNDDEGGN